jgi:hypothetical protein
MQLECDGGRSNGSHSIGEGVEFETVKLPGIVVVIESTKHSSVNKKYKSIFSTYEDIVRVLS